jgi:uncharacterized membrane protein
VCGASCCEGCRLVAELIKTYIHYISSGIEICAALIVLLSVGQATFRSLWLFFTHPPQHEERKLDLRLQLGRWLTIALEFELAADILRTTIAPTWNEIGKLAAIIVLRTLLNFFLEREIRMADRRGLPG